MWRRLANRKEELFFRMGQHAPMTVTAIRIAPPFCFRARNPPASVSATVEIRLGDEAAHALARLVPLLGCGEEAAALAFGEMAEREDDPVTQVALDAIACEERVHDALLRGLAAALPPVDARSMTRMARRFHIDLGRGPPVAHLARIAAIDAGVCTILSRVLRSGGAVAADTGVAGLLSRIRRDEARHVMLSRTIAIGRAEGRALNDVAAGAREALADVLTLAGDAFEVLGVDPARLFADLRAVPNGLLRA